MTTVVSFTVVGVPRPQGSKAAFNAKNGKAMMRESGGVGFAAWRNAVAEAALRQRDDLAAAGVAVPLDGPLSLNVAFRFPMPKSAPKRLRPWRPKSTAPDLSKLVRAVEDALQAAGLIADDARFCHCWANKYEYEGWSGAQIVIGRVP